MVDTFFFYSTLNIFSLFMNYFSHEKNWIFFTTFSLFIFIFRDILNIIISICFYSPILNITYSSPIPQNNTRRVSNLKNSTMANLRASTTTQIFVENNSVSAAIKKINAGVEFSKRMSRDQRFKNTENDNKSKNLLLLSIILILYSPTCVLTKLFHIVNFP